jgi:hypothetical protein
MSSSQVDRRTCCSGVDRIVFSCRHFPNGFCWRWLPACLRCSCFRLLSGIFEHAGLGGSNLRNRWQ